MVAGQDVGYPIAEAARRLGLTPGAVRKRIKRGTLPAYKGLDGQWYVPVPGDSPQGSPPPDGHAEPAYDAAQDGGQAALYERLIDQQASEIAHLRGELQRTQEALAEERRIIAHLVARLPELAAPIEATANGHPHDVTAAETSTPAPAAPVRRPWWQVWRRN